MKSQCTACSGKNPKCRNGVGFARNLIPPPASAMLEALWAGLYSIIHFSGIFVLNFQPAFAPTLELQNFPEATSHSFFKVFGQTASSYGRTKVYLPNRSSFSPSP